jgi:hypothetical protein
VTANPRVAALVDRLEESDHICAQLVGDDDPVEPSEIWKRYSNRCSALRQMRA